MDENPLWNEFKCFELKEIMRQRDLDFITALNNFVSNKMTDSDLNLFKSRETTEKEIEGKKMIRLYPTNAQVDMYNDQMINTHSESEILSYSKDQILNNKLSKNQISKELDKLKTIDRNKTNRIPYLICLKIGINYYI